MVDKIESKEELDAALAPIKARVTEEQFKEMVCTLIGHSRIIDTSFCYVYCARCGDQIGDTLGGSFNGRDHVINGHDCSVCRENAKALTWRDTVYAPDPFAKEPSNG